MKKKITYLLFLFIVTAIFSEEITVDENEIFGNSEVIVDKKESSKSVDEELNLKKYLFQVISLMKEAAEQEQHG